MRGEGKRTSLEFSSRFDALISKAQRDLVNLKVLEFFSDKMAKVVYAPIMFMPKGPEVWGHTWARLFSQMGVIIFSVCTWVKKCLQGR